MWELALDFKEFTSLQKIASVPTATVKQSPKVHEPLVLLFEKKKKTIPESNNVSFHEQAK